MRLPKLSGGKMRLSQRRCLQWTGRSVVPTLKSNVSRSGGQNWALIQQRTLHAQWTYLLDHTWIVRQSNPTIGKSPSSQSTWDQCIESDESTDNPSTRTILFVHDSHADKSMCEDSAKSFICKAAEDFPSNDRFPVQCLLVNLRGSGASSSDDYHNAHTVTNATEDVLTLVQTVCTGNVRGPGLVVAYGTLGEAIARCYTASLLNQGGVTQHVHSEVSGKGAIKPPFVVLLVPNTATAPDINEDLKKRKKNCEYEDDVSQELLESAKDYLSSEKNIQSLVGQDSQDVPVKFVAYEGDASITESLYALSLEKSIFT